MQQTSHHPWDLTAQDAGDLQIELARQVIADDRFTEINTVAGVDVAYDEHSHRLVAAVVVLEARSLAVIESATATDVERFPYIPGLFSIRELPPLAEALGQLRTRPDLIGCGVSPIPAGLAWPATWVCCSKSQQSAAPRRGW